MLDTICEPVILPDDRQILVDLARVADAKSAPDVFFHFHDVAELILFGVSELDADCYVENEHYELGPGSVVYIPPMRRHGFDIRKGRRNRLLIQFHLSASGPNGSSGGGSPLQSVICTQPQERIARKLEMLGVWLLEATRTDPLDPTNQDILHLMLRFVAQSSRLGKPISPRRSAIALRHRHRLDALLLRLNSDPGENIPLEQAAALCCLSPSYFSRVFRKAFGMTYSSYRRSQKLRIAARRLCTSSRQVAQIGYELGFASPSHFVAAFREEFGATPERYRRRYAEWGRAAQTGGPPLDLSAVDLNCPVDWARLASP